MSGIEQCQQSRWLSILKEQVQKSSRTDVARQLGYSRSVISLVLAGKYPGSMEKVREAVMERFTNYVICPHLGCDLSRALCRDHQSRPMPTSDPAALRHWIACRSGCPHSTHITDDEVCHA